MINNDIFIPLCHICLKSSRCCQAVNALSVISDIYELCEFSGICELFDSGI